jgi:hypothetical protein
MKKTYSLPSYVPLVDTSGVRRWRRTQYPTIIFKFCNIFHSIFASSKVQKWSSCPFCPIFRGFTSLTGSEIQLQIKNHSFFLYLALMFRTNRMQFLFVAIFRCLSRHFQCVNIKLISPLHSPHSWSRHNIKYLFEAGIFIIKKRKVKKQKK